MLCPVCSWRTGIKESLKVIMKIFFLVLTLSKVCFANQHPTTDCKFTSREHALDAVIQSNYSNQEPPEKLVEVHVQITFVNFFQLNEMDSTIKSFVMVVRSWQDKRLSTTCKFPRFGLTKGEAKRLWKPDVAFAGSLSIERAKGKDEHVVMKIATGGNVMDLDRFVIQMPCKMNFRKFPFDSMYCDYPLSSSEAENQDGTPMISIKWADPPAKLTPKFNFLSTHEILDFNATFEAYNLLYGGNPSIMPVIRVRFVRLFTSYLLQAYLPNIIIVVVAWLGFSIDPTSLAARGTLGVSSLLSLIVQFGNLADTIPKVGYLKGIDLWMLGCVMFVTFSLVEFGYLCHLIRKGKADVKKPINVIDGWSKVVYPLVFVIFVVVYLVFSIA